MSARSEHGGGREALDRELASCEEDEPPWPMLGEQGAVTEAVLNELPEDAEFVGTWDGVAIYSTETVLPHEIRRLRRLP